MPGFLATFGSRHLFFCLELSLSPPKARHMRAVFALHRCRRESNLKVNCSWQFPFKVPNTKLLCRYLGSCRYAYSCSLGSWTSWSGHIPYGYCSTQTRYRDWSTSLTYSYRTNNCHGVRTSCGSRENDHRKYCEWCKEMLHWKYYVSSVQNWGKYILMFSKPECLNVSIYRHS